MDQYSYDLEGLIKAIRDLLDERDALRLERDILRETLAQYVDERKRKEQCSPTGGMF